jgi:mannosyltransferase
MVRLLDQIDGTRAPLHPLVLRGWLRVFGSSDRAGRSFSAVCGLATVLTTYLIGRRAFDGRTALWSAWLAAVCPPLVYYSQEARMYSWLVFLTTLSWLAFLSFRRAAGPIRCARYGVLLTALAYSHPLGLFMIAAHGVAYLLVRRHLALGFRSWLATQIGVGLAILPWLGRYLGHGTDYPMPRYSLRFLLGVPIEYIGGNGVALLACLAIVVVGWVSREVVEGRRRLAIREPVENLILVAWAAVPPVLMYGYSHVAQPIFGPSRYHLFCAPAYLILVAHGLSRLPAWLRWPLAAIGLTLSLSLLQVYRPSPKADWRALAAWLGQDQTRTPDNPIAVVVHAGDPRFLREPLEAARYYLGPGFRVVGAGESSEREAAGKAITYDVYCVTIPNDERHRNAQTFQGILVEKRH